MPAPAAADLLAQIKGRPPPQVAATTTSDEASSVGNEGRGAMLAQMMAARKAATGAGGSSANQRSGAVLGRRSGSEGEAAASTRRMPTPPSASTPATTESNQGSSGSVDFGDAVFVYDEAQEAFLFAAHHLLNVGVSVSTEKLTSPTVISSESNNQAVRIVVPLAQCVYRMTDYTYAKKEPIVLERCLLKLGVLRCLARECHNLNRLLLQRFGSDGDEVTVVGEAFPPTLPFVGDGSDAKIRTSSSIARDSSTPPPPPSPSPPGSLEEDELAKTRFMELLSNCGVYQKVSELILQQCAKAAESRYAPQIQVDALEDFLQAIEQQAPCLQQAREEIATTATVSFYPGLGELFTPGSQLTCYPGGMEGTPLGCQVVQCWYDQQEINPATHKIKRRFIVVVEFIVSVGDELVFVAASDVYPEFHDPNRNMPIKDLSHRKLDPKSNVDDRVLLQRLQQRGEFYASVATKNHYLEYHPNSFFPIIGGGWSNNAVRPLSKGGRVMVDVKRGILEGHLPVRASDGMSDTVKEAIKLFEQSKRTGVAVPFRTCILPGFDGLDWKSHQIGDRASLWQAWPMLTGFSFTARVWGKLLLGMPKLSPVTGQPLPGGSVHKDSLEYSPKRAAQKKLGVSVAALGGVGSCGNCGYIHFQEKAFDQLVLAEDKKELIRAVARNAGGGPKFDASPEDDDEDEDDDDDVGIDVVANKGGASIFLLYGPPGCGKTLTAEAIAELLRKPLYVVTAGDLGTDAAQVEKTLGSVLELCQTWDALVLIDEADIFLEARNSHEIQRNALVCVMLRLLEYYSGCLFLSSNRAAHSIDAAIASRITVMLGYPPLDVDGRAKVWKNLLELIPVVPERYVENKRKASKYRVEFTELNYDILSKVYGLNGRQIKNSIVLARALARERETPISMDILHRAVTAVAGEKAKIVSGVGN